jgi:transposase-like protein
MPSKYKRSIKPRTSPTGRKSPPTGTDADLNLASMSAMFSDEDQARDFIESRRWPDGVPVCPHCGKYGAYKLTSKPESKTQVRPGLYKCRACRRPFSVRIGTIFEESKIPLCKWLMAIHLMTSSKKGISSHQIARELVVTVKTGWFLTHRIRECMKQGAPLLGGMVEADECYIGGKPRPQNKAPRTGKRDKATEKEPVAVLVQRDGQAICHPIPGVTQNELRRQVKRLVSKDATLMTDDSSIYRGRSEHFAGGHHTVVHSRGEYARFEGDQVIHTNTAESFFALLKRGHYGRNSPFSDGCYW